MFKTMARLTKPSNIEGSAVIVVMGMGVPHPASFTRLTNESSSADCRLSEIPGTFS